MRNNKLFASGFVNQSANSCSLCQSAMHLSPFCPNHLNKETIQNAPNRTYSPSVDVRGRTRVKFNGQEICNNFNSVKGCNRSYCSNAHVCLTCKKEHSQQSCQNAKKLADYKCKSAEITVKRCSVNIEQLQLELINHPDRSFVDYLIDGFVHGFKTGLSSLPAHSFECRYLQSANRYPESTPELLETELNKGYIIGPYDTIPFSQYRINHVAEIS